MNGNMNRNDVIRENFETTREDGKTIRGIICRPDVENDILPTVIFSHGFGSCYAELEHHGRGFAEKGIVCVLFDFCGGGMDSTSDGTMQEMSVITEADDLRIVMDYVQKLPYVDNNSLYLQGESQGGLASAIVGKRRQEEIKGLILWYPAFIIPDDARSRMRQGINDVFGYRLSPQYNEDAVGVDVEELQRGFDKPVLLIHGDKDGVVPIEYSRQAEANYKYATLKEIPGAGHGFDGKDSDEAREMSIRFVQSD